MNKNSKFKIFQSQADTTFSSKAVLERAQNQATSNYIRLISSMAKNHILILGVDLIGCYLTMQPP